MARGATPRKTRKTVVFLGVAREALRKTLVGVYLEKLTFSLVGKGGGHPWENVSFPRFGKEVVPSELFGFS